MKHSVLTCLVAWVVLTSARLCSLAPLGEGRDDTDHVLDAISTCGINGVIELKPGSFNITRKMTWTLHNTIISLRGKLTFPPNVTYWLDPANTYRIVRIQSQASWFVVTGSNFVIDGHGVGGIDGQGQTWWEYYQSHAKADGDGRPISLTLHEAKNAVVRNFRIESPPFWCNTVAQSSDVVYDGMYCNATNANPIYTGKNIVPNTDGICTYRSDTVILRNWDITCGDDCLAIKGNSTNIYAHGVTCRGGNGIAVGSLGQYIGEEDNVHNVLLEDLKLLRLPEDVQPNMQKGIYFKSWTGTANGEPPTAGGGGLGTVTNITARRVFVDRVRNPVQLYQTNNGKSTDAPSQLSFSNLTFEDWSGTAVTTSIVDMRCSSAASCPGITFKMFNVTGPEGQAPTCRFDNVIGSTGLDSTSCTA
ncbi:pectin lyase-like protein [Auriculariales sp. MPI-PUGE-AT-0066]|nr:pectin lyase-like protein [Auriculariales sp. MPI-PUGE-AT-0066]